MSSESALPPLQGKQLILATIAVALATFMIVLDSSIANVAIPTIAGNLGVSVNEGTWVITLFAAANAITIPLTGWLTQRYGQVRLFISAIFLFVLASFLCGFASDLSFLLFARILQGLVAGPLIPLSQALLLSTYPKEKSAFALALWGMTATVGPIAGPTLGGWITDNYHWSWIFYINIPVGFFAAAVTWKLFKTRETPTSRSSIDTIGLVLLVIWVGALQVMLDKGNDMGWFDSSTIIILGLIAVIGFCYFLVWELTVENPVIDLRLFNRRNFAAGTIAISVGYGVFFGNLVLLPQWMQQDLGYPAISSGLAMAPLGFFAVLCSPFIGRFLVWIDARVLITFAFMLFGLVFYLRSLYSVDIDTWALVLPTLIQGIPMAMFFIPLTVIILSGLPSERIAAAAGLSNFVRVFFGAIGTSIATTIWTNRSIVHHAQLSEQATPYTQSFMDYMSSLHHLLNIDSGGQRMIVNRIINHQSNTLAIDDIFFISAWIFILLIPLVWLTKPAKMGMTKINMDAH